MNKIRSISKFSVPFQGFLFKADFQVTAHSKGAALRSAMQSEEFAPRHCFGVPKRVKVLHICNK